MRKAGILAATLLLVGGCQCGGNVAEPCVDEDGDTYDSCSECDDGNPDIHPGAPEVCGNGVDDNCNNQIDERCAPDEDGGSELCRTGETRSCGVTGSQCFETCRDGGVWGACEGPAGPVDLDGDPRNCGRCGNVCPEPVHAAVACSQGVCGRGPCEAGWYDLDGDGGCRWQCTDSECTAPEGNTLQVSARPLPERGAVFQALSSGSSWGGHVQTGTNHTNFGVLGEPTPPGVDGAVEQVGERYRNVGGLNAVQPQ